MCTTHQIEPGLIIDTCFGICLDPDGPVIDLDEKQLQLKVKHAQVLLDELRDAETVEWYLSNSNGRTDWQAVAMLDEHPEHVSIFENAPDNDFISEEHNRYCLEMLDKLNQRRARKNLKRSPDKSLRVLIIERDQNKCRYCGNPAGRKPHIDHVIPYSLGGRTEINNLVLACETCNLKKSGKTPQQAGMELLT